MWYPYCMTSFVLDPSTSFFVSCDLTLTLGSKNRKIWKMKNENENGKWNKEKLSPPFVNLTLYYLKQINQ